MRVFLAVLFSLVQHHVYAQLLDPSADWFSLQDFFQERYVKEKAIVSLNLSVEEKADGEKIRDSGEKLSYFFNASGKLIRAEKKIPLSRGFDTAFVDYEYDIRGRLTKTVEHYGPYHFIYLNHFANDLVFTSLKINPKLKKRDTLYNRTHRIDRKEQTEIEKISNEKGGVFIEKKRSFDAQDRLIQEKVGYTYSRNRSRARYIYQQDQLIESLLIKDFRVRQEERRQFSYEAGKLKEVLYFKNDKLNTRTAFTYAQGLLSAIIIRNQEEGWIKIYRLHYELY